MIPRHLRNPRRAYDADGREWTPATVANAQKNWTRGIIARCACNHEALLPFTRLHPNVSVPDIALRLRCSACSGTRVTAYADWTSGWRSVR
jgi:hypothetical protein